MTSPLELAVARRLPIGAEAAPGRESTRFRVWAPGHAAVSVLIEGDRGRVIGETELKPERDGYFSGVVAGARAGSLYRYRLGENGNRFPDPASRFQPLGPHGPSEVIDPEAFTWTDDRWRGITLEGQVLYEMHIGTFTPEGTWQAAATKLQRLAALGITGLEVMPVAEFAGRFGWGYDGVDLFAPYHHYGTPDDFRRFVDRAHALGLGVLLDVVYNHLGPDGNFLREFSPRYFSSRYENEWGEALNFDEDAGPVRELIVSNAAYWIREFHLDGLRLDATQQIFDASQPHLLSEITRAARAAAGSRSILLVAENERQDARLLRGQNEGGYGLDALWNDDFHHAAVVALTGRREAYYTDYAGSPQEFVSLVRWGFLYQGQRYSWQRARRGTPALDVEPKRFITFLENHDQVANCPGLAGDRVRRRSHPSLYRAMTAYWLLSPGTPMFFQGQERGTEVPFLYFADHQGALGEAVRAGRAEFMRQFRTAATRDLDRHLSVPSDVETVRRCTLADDEGASPTELELLHRDLLRLRRDDPAIARANARIEGAVLGAHAFVLRFLTDQARSSGHDDRLLVVNLGGDLHLEIAPEPLLAPPAGCEWSIHWSSENPIYGGWGTAPLDTDTNWHLPAHAAVLLAARTS